MPQCSAFDLEIRRRVWFAIGVLDTQTALDRGSLPLMSSEDFKTPPLNIDDYDLFASVRSVPKRFTDMSFSSLTHEAMICQKRLLTSDKSQTNTDTWTEKIAIVRDFEESMNRQYPSCDEKDTPLQRYASLAAKDIATTIHLLLRRPPYRNIHINVPEWDDFDIIRVTTTVLERSMTKQKSSDFSPWAWFQWVRWYALAVLLVELHSDRQGPSIDRAYLIAQRSFTQYASLVADSQTGLLWKPIAKLMHQVRHLRGDAKGYMDVEVSTLLTQKPQSSDMMSDSNTMGDSAEFSQHSMSHSERQIISYDPDQVESEENVAGGSRHVGMREADSLQADMDHMFDLEEKLPWLNWDVFLADVDSVTGVA